MTMFMDISETEFTSKTSSFLDISETETSKIMKKLSESGKRTEKTVRKDENKIMISFRTQFGYGMGHIQNDIVASIWFSYTLLFYKLALGSSSYYLLVFGQAVDCFATILSGFVFDSLDTKNIKLFSQGRYKTWYMIGFVLLTLGISHSFLELPFMINKTSTMYGIYAFSLFISQIGWTFNQISHLSMMNIISWTRSDRVRLTSWRQGGTIYSAIVVFAWFWYTLTHYGNNILSKNDVKLFSNNIYWLTTFGACHSLLFMYLIDENSITNAKADYSKKHRKKFSEASRDRIMNYYTRKDWLKSPIFYIVVSFLHKNNISKYITIYILS